MSVSISVSGTGPAIALSGAGANATNTTAVEVRAAVVGSTLISNGAVTVRAADRADTATTPSATALVVAVSVTIAGSASIALSGSVAAAIASNTQADRVEAVIEGGSVTAGGAVVVDAVNAGLVEAEVGAGSLAGSMGAGGSLAVAVALASNNVTNTVTAAVRGGADRHRQPR